MFSEADVNALFKDRRLKAPVASLFVNTDRGHPDGEKFLANFRHVVHEAHRALTRRPTAESALAAERLKEALPELLTFFDREVSTEPVVRGVALFVSLALPADHDPRTPAFTAFTLPRPLRNQAQVAHRPVVRPLIFLLDQYERVGVIVADRGHARIFTLFLGELAAMVRRNADTPRRHDQGGWSKMFFQRDLEGHVRAHLRDTVRVAVRLFRLSPLHRIVLGGTKETVSLLERALPYPLRQVVAGRFLVGSHASDAEVIAKALALAAAAEQEEERRRVAELTDALAHRPTTPTLRSEHGIAHGAGRVAAVSGLADTLEALAEQRVQRLLLERGRHAAGAACDNCGALLPETVGVCRYCAHPLHAVPDALEHAVERARAERAEVEFISESAALAALGGVGAILRF